MSLLVFLVVFTILECSTVRAMELRILSLVPLTGPEEDRGRAQLAGINLALQEDLHKLSGLPDIQVQYNFTDTKCEPKTEGEIVFGEILAFPGPLIVLGGGCYQSSSQHTDFDRSPVGYLSTAIPTVSFDEESESHVNGGYHINVRESVTSANDDIISLLRRHHWSEVAVVYSSTHTYIGGQRSLVSSLSKQEVNVSLVIDESTEHLHSILQESGSRVVVLYTDSPRAAEVVCSTPSPLAADRYIWIHPTRDQNSQQHISSICDRRGTDPSVFIIEVPQTDLKTSEYQIFKHLVDSEQHLQSDTTLQRHAAYAYEATKLTLENLFMLLTSPNGRFVDRKEFAERFTHEVVNSQREGVVGTLRFTQDGRRKVATRVKQFGAASMSPETVGARTEVDGIPLSLFVIMCSLALVGSAYSIAILVFNIAKQKDKIIKMTSPNINVIILLGAVFGYSTMVLLGLDSGRVSPQTMAKYLQAGAFILVISFTFVYGATFTKSWRVYMIFKNVNANGKLTRDEHLLLGVVIMLVLDLAILLPWTLSDPIQCNQIALHSYYQAESQSDVTVMMDVCASRLQDVWVSVIYVYKAAILALGAFFTWQTRHVTLPALRDTREVYITMYSVAVLALVCLPGLLIRNAGVKVKYATGATAIWLLLTATITLLFVPKIQLYKKAKKNGQQDTKFQFKESMEKTREAVGKCSFCFCCTEKDEDKYAHEVLHNEIETLKMTIKEKDASIRELNDRLYIGAEKFQEYLVSPKRKYSVLDAMQKKHARRTRSQPTHVRERERKRQKSANDRASRLTGHLSLDYDYNNYHGVSVDKGDNTFSRADISEMEYQSDYQDTNGIAVISGSDNSPKRASFSQRRMPLVTDLPTPIPGYHKGKARHTRPVCSPSPNHDSAIDNNSPSSDTGSSEREEHLPGDYGFGSEGRDSSKMRSDVYAMPIDLEAMESDAASGRPWTVPEVNSNYHLAVRLSDRQGHDHYQLEPYKTATINGVSVSQI